MIIQRHQVWKQKKGAVRLRINFFCRANQCPFPEIQRELHADHAHVIGWNANTGGPTNHTVIATSRLQHNYFLESEA